MPKVLREQQIASYADNGFLSPFTVCSPKEAAALHDRFEDMEKTLGEEPQKRFRVKAHLPFPWLCDLIKHPTAGRGGRFDRSQYLLLGISLFHQEGA